MFLLLCGATFSCLGQAKKNIQYSGLFDTYYWSGPMSYTAGIGLAGYSGDVCSSLSCTKLSPYFTLGMGYKVLPRIFVGGEFDLFSLKAEDKIETRGYDFESNNLELAFYTNFYLREDIVRRHQDLVKKHKLVKPYIYAGFSFMNFVVNSDNNEVQYPRNAFLLPLGLGVNFHFTHRINVKVEGVYKLGFTDYLDGVSETAGPGRDSYGILRVKLVYTPFARRMKPKKVKVDAEQRKQWNDRYNQGSGGSESSGSGSSDSSSSGSSSSSSEDESSSESSGDWSDEDSESDDSSDDGGDWGD